MENPVTCAYCGGSLTATPYQGHPELVDLDCRNSDCKMGWVNQSARCTGPGTSQLVFGLTGITRLDQRKPSQGEDNCGPVARAMLAWLGEGFKFAMPCPEKGSKRNSTTEHGFDFSIYEPCGHATEIQVTRVPEQAHFAALGAANRQGLVVVDERSHATLVDLIESALRNKTGATPIRDRANRILAIDGLDLSIGFNFFLTAIRSVDTGEVYGWRGVVLVCDERNLMFFGSDDWPGCSKCKEVE